jgi:hypothetical protein
MAIAHPPQAALFWRRALYNQFARLRKGGGPTSSPILLSRQPVGNAHPKRAFGASVHHGYVDLHNDITPHNCLSCPACKMCLMTVAVCKVPASII